MAIRRHLAGPWRGPSVYDDAIDWTRTPRAEYVATRDVSLVRYLPGAEPTLWTLRDLRQSEIAYLRDHWERGEVATCYQRAFRLALEDCSDPEMRFEVHGERRMLSDESFELVPTAVWMELGALAYQRTEVTPGEAPRYALPRGSPPIRTRRPDTTADDASGSASPRPSRSDSDAESQPTS